MSGAFLHTIFDVAAWLAAAAALWWLSRVRGLTFPAQSFELPYIAALVFGAGVGAYLFGTLNLWLSGQDGIARSIEGALAGGIAAIELYKWKNGIALRTGARFALPLALGIAIGRIGCYLAGLDDFTYGTPTTLPWGHDFGDGILRHPVQLYESLAMAAFALVYVVAVLRHDDYCHHQRLLPRTRLVRPAALRLGISQTLWRAGRPSDIVPPAVALRPALRRLHAGNGAHCEVRS
jgi:hypothetical protein